MRSEQNKRHAIQTKFPGVEKDALPISSDYASLIIRLWRVPGGEAGTVGPGWRSEVEHIQSGGRWEISSLRELEQFLRDFLRQLGGEEQNK